MEILSGEKMSEGTSKVNLKVTKSEERKESVTPYPSKFRQHANAQPNDSGYFTPSPASCNGCSFIERVGDSSIISNLVHKQVQLKVPTNRRNLEPALNLDRLAGVHTVITSQSSISCEGDIIQQLTERDLWDILAKIFVSLDGRDLTTVCCVCKLWRDALLDDDSANRRRKKYLKNFRSNRENTQKDVEISTKVGTNRRPFDSVSNQVLQPESKNQSAQSNASKVDVVQQRFEDVIKSLKPHERLDKCGKCGSPARVNKQTKQAVCSLPGCMYDYCVTCRCPYSPTHQCSPVKLRLSSKVVKGRSSKWSLRRLLL